MKRDCKTCIWYKDCKANGGIHANCEEHTPADESEINESYYIDNLKSRAADYRNIEKDFN